MGTEEKFSFSFFNDTATTEIYTLSLHDALPICTKKVKEIRVDYKKAAVLGEVLIPRVTKTGEDERTIVLAGEDKEIRAVVWLKYEEA